ncbi:triple tyrosine motif-containing protein [Clostridium ganghwense]|uniref:Triple tyrosine motif-containing protein n=1 Tax=Clostridium ganghwense TaxID=312089 RepID=A0ABT4CL09_9CLOT|nr:triple tyrosine motif-containing protein [Clostridium ganghwense]MCY6369729.1 triple tyrosine motif-containing protein [Clostridium ganghwense]
MNEIIIGYNKESPQEKNSEIKINIIDKPKENLLFKYIVGFNGAWETLKEFSEDESIIWKPEIEGSYILMVQAKEENSTKSFDYVSKNEYIIGKLSKDENELIKDIHLNKKKFCVGEKIHLKVETKQSSVLYRYMIKENEKWILAKDYSKENAFVCSVKDPGEHEILVQCKLLDSRENFQEARKVEYKVVEMKKLEINVFKCLTSELLVDEELVFEVGAQYDDNRMILYKFVKINSNGQTKCIQDYSTKKVVSYKENNSGKYRILCLAKDMYSPKQYDDRAIMHYEVKPYKKVEILSFVSDLSSPQIMEKSITFKAVASGGKELRYRYLIEGPKNENSGYIKSSEYIWEPKESGDYKINLFVKDVSFTGKYEDGKSILFTIDEIPRDPVKIDEIILDKKESVLVKESVNIKVIAEGGITLLYSFIIRKDSVEKERIDYGECNWVKFTPELEGRFEIEIRVKDKYSDKVFDVHEIKHIDAYKYIPANIDYVLMEPKEYYLIGDQMVLDVITQDTEEILIKYVLQINGHKVEETDYVKSKRYILTPKCSGRYIVKVYAKNKKSDKKFDSSKEVSIVVNDAPPVTNTTIKCDRFSFSPNEPIEITAESNGGKDVVYEFYLMEKSEWNLVQKYSKKNYYDFIPFTKGIYKILALAKSNYNKKAYEDYCMIDIKVTEKLSIKDLVDNKDIQQLKHIVDNNILSDLKLTEEERKSLI